MITIEYGNYDNEVVYRHVDLCKSKPSSRTRRFAIISRIVQVILVAAAVTSPGHKCYGQFVRTIPSPGPSPPIELPGRSIGVVPTSPVTTPVLAPRATPSLPELGLGPSGLTSLDLTPFSNGFRQRDGPDSSTASSLSLFIKASDPVSWQTGYGLGRRTTLRWLAEQGVVSQAGYPGKLKKVFKVQLITILPITKETFSNVFGRMPRYDLDPEVDELSRVRREVQRFKSMGALNLGGASDGTERLKDEFRTASSQGFTGVILVGHSVGQPGITRSLVLPDEPDHRVSMAEIYAWGNEAGLECRVLTCYGSDFGVDEPLALSDARRLLADVNRLLGPPKEQNPSNERAAQAGRKDSSVASGHEASSPLTFPTTTIFEAWDFHVASLRDSQGASGVVLIGSTLSCTGDVRLWESVRKRPFWLSLSAWLLLATGVAANALAILATHRQSLSSVDSMRIVAELLGEQYRITKEIRRSTKRVVFLCLGVTTATLWLLKTESQFDSATGWLNPFSLPYFITVLGLTLAVVGAIVSRTDPLDSRLGRWSHGLGGGVAGGAVAFVATIQRVIFGVALFLLWVNFLHLLAGISDELARFPLLLGASLWGGLTLAVCLSLVISLYGVGAGLRAGWGGLPLLPTMFHGSGYSMMGALGSPRRRLFDRPAIQPVRFIILIFKSNLFRSPYFFFFAGVGSLGYCFHLAGSPPMAPGTAVLFQVNGDSALVSSRMLLKVVMPILSRVPVVPVVPEMSARISEIGDEFFKSEATRPFLPDFVDPRLGYKNPTIVADLSYGILREHYQRMPASQRVNEYLNQKIMNACKGLVFSPDESYPAGCHWVADGSRGEVVADDLGGWEQRWVLVRVKRHCTIKQLNESDPGVLVLARSCQLQRTD
jgi:hypothetical protein